jgi:hypothetical protein
MKGLVAISWNLPQCRQLIDLSMSLFHRVRKAVNELLAPSGIAIDRTEKRSWKWLSRTVTSRVASSNLQMD